MSRRVPRLVALLVALPLGGPLVGQTVPFGKNKIQYTEFDWRVLSGEHLDVYYYPEEEDLARLALAYGEESYRFLEERFQHHPFRRIPLVVYSSHQHFEQTNVTPGFIPEGVLGFTEFLKRRVALPFRGSYAQFRHTLRHELVHVFHLSKLTETFALHGRVRRAALPHWWSEGLAEFWSSPQDTDDEMVIRDVVLSGRLPSLLAFTYSASFLSYPLGGELFHYLAERFGEHLIPRLYEDLWRYDSFEDAFAGVFGVSLEDLDREWRYHLERRHFPVYADRPPVEVEARPLDGAGGAFKPLVRVLPGDTVARLFFLSPRTGYTNIYTARLSSPGRERILVEGERTAEFESFHAYESRMDLSRDGVLAFVSKFQERDALFLWSVADEKVVGRYQWEDLVGLQSPSWSPDGTRIAFSGLSVSGPANIYVMDFAAGTRSAVTADRYQDRDPDWSPDGAWIVFSSDRTTDGAGGAQNLFLYDVARGGLHYLTHGPWRDQAPRWSNDGRRVAFVSDRSGFHELYTVAPDGSGRRVSHFTGAAFDPEWLPDDSGLVFAGFAAGTFRLYALDLDVDGPGELIAVESPPPGMASWSADDGGGNGHGLPAFRPTWDWSELEEARVADLPSRQYSDWRSVSVDFAGGEALIAPGVASGQGIQFLGSDMLGNHILFASVSAFQAEASRNLADAFSGQLLYLNLKRRLNVGGGAFRYKGLFRDVSFNVYEEESYGGFFLASYPFSKFERIELQMGLDRSDRLDREDFFRLDGREDPRNLTRDALLARNFLSYVKDNTLWLPTGPIDGTRYNLTAGLVTDLSRGRAENFVLMGDYRRYVRTSLYTALALRTFGYYSGGAIPGRAVLGGPHQLRGYPRLSLAGSRVWLVNTEWRFPLLHGVTFNLPIGDLRFPGVQAATFTDIGSSWLEGQEPEGTWGSYGLGLRMSLGYALVLRLDAGKRFRIGEAPPLYFRPDEHFNDGFVDFFFGFNY